MIYVLLFIAYSAITFAAGAKYGRAAEAKVAAEFRELVAGAKKEIDKVL